MSNQPMINHQSVENNRPLRGAKYRLLRQDSTSRPLLESMPGDSCVTRQVFVTPDQVVVLHFWLAVLVQSQSNPAPMGD